MGLDKLRLIVRRRPHQEFIDEINSVRDRPSDEQRFQFRISEAHSGPVKPTTPMTLWTKRGIEPGFYLQMNYLPPGGKAVRDSPQHILECNPNKFNDGLKGFQALVDQIFGSDFGDPKVSRIDLNADIENVPVDYFRQVVRVPRKRKSGDVGRMVETYSSCGVKTFYIGRNPARLRIYDKREELQQGRHDVSRLPAVLTRIEWEFRHKRCPISCLSELPMLLDLEPFRDIQLLETSAPAIDSRSREAKKLYDLHKRIDDFGLHEAIRLLNYPDRHFIRDYQELLVPNDVIKRRLQDAYIDSTSRFFRNERADVEHIYNHAN